MNPKIEPVMVVDRKTNIAELVSKFPEVAEVMLGYGLHCVGCFASQFDNIEEGARIHQMDEEEIDELIEEINMVIRGEASLDD